MNQSSEQVVLFGLVSYRVFWILLQPSPFY